MTDKYIISSNGIIFTARTASKNTELVTNIWDMMACIEQGKNATLETDNVKSDLSFIIEEIARHN